MTPCTPIIYMILNGKKIAHDRATVVLKQGQFFANFVFVIRKRNVNSGLT